MTVNPDLNREAIVQYLTLMELAYEDLSLEGALRLAQRALVESDYQFIRENDDYLSFELGTPLQIRLKAVLAIFDQEAAEHAKRRLASYQIIKFDTKKDMDEAGITLGDVQFETKVVTRDSLARELGVQVDPYSHPDDKV